jgi:hypothetical protein
MKQVIAILIGLVLIYVVNRRKFNRRSITGMELFSSFEKAWLTRLLEGLGKLLAYMLITAATIGQWTGCITRHHPALYELIMGYLMEH